MLGLRKIEGIQELRNICQDRPEKVVFLTSKYLYRPLSIYLTYFFLKLRFSANFVSFLSIISAFIGSLFLITANINLIPFGYFFFWFFYLLDFSDGEVARYNKTNSLTGHFIELIAHYIVNILFFMSSAYFLVIYTGHDYIYIFAIFGLIGDVLIKVKNPIIWQVVVVEHLRLNSRMRDKSTTKYEVNTEYKNYVNKKKLPLKARNIFISLFYFIKKNILLGHYTANAIFIPFFLASLLSLILSIYVLILLYIYTCIINTILGFKVIYDTIAKNKSERSYNSLFDTKEDIDFNL